MALPESIRSDNGPEFRSDVLQRWANAKGIHRHFIQPGCPEQNGYIERFNDTYQLEVLDASQFRSLDEARTVTEEWLAVYNEQPTHSATGHLPPLRSSDDGSNVSFQQVVTRVGVLTTRRRFPLPDLRATGAASRLLSLRPSGSMCGATRADAVAWLEELEHATRPAEVQGHR